MREGGFFLVTRVQIILRMRTKVIKYVLHLILALLLPSRPNTSGSLMRLYTKAGAWRVRLDLC